SAEQAGADFENIRLLQSADLATNYFNLRALDVELDVLQRSIALQNRALELVSSRHDLGAATGLDVAQQQALLDTTLVQVDVLRRQRGQFEHAIATLAGIPAPLFSLAPDARALTPPAVPLGLPSDLLERRPDIASAERAMAAANAQIGVANAAFYPSIILGSALGAESNRLSTLFDAPSLLWSLGLSATEVLFDGGRIKANLEVAKLGHAAAVANYRRVVLGAMQEVEDGITGLAALDRASAQARITVNTASRVLDMATARYEGGASAYLDVITAQQSWLASERQASQLLGQRLVTSVFLVKALGGDWQAAPQTVSKNQP
ncbi:MAG: efflux transporter outer membrane subunit, partial [Rhodoferax sp.]|uniref:efflux transporter outer membrane subunit n=1 Tax=Rhodoferax sp. TaxID=50421 RepID=UPI003267AC71